MRKAIARTLTLSLLIAGALAAPAPAATVTSGQLEWTQFNVYELAAPQGTNRTWLGYVTGGPPLANGAATPSDGATGDPVTPASARGADQAYAFGFSTTTGGSYDEYTGTGTVELTGTLTFTSAAHGFTISVEDPQVRLDGSTGQLFASGVKSGDPATYDRSEPVFDLDLSDAAVTLHPDGSRMLSGIVPSIATADYVFPGYAQGAGAERTPATPSAHVYDPSPRAGP